MLLFQNLGGFEQKTDVCVLGGRLIFLLLQNLIISCRVSLWMVVKIYIVIFSLKDLLFCTRQIAFRAVVWSWQGQILLSPVQVPNGSSVFVSCWKSCCAPPRGGDNSETKQLYYLGDLFFCLFCSLYFGFVCLFLKEVSLEGKGTVGAEIAVTANWKS